MRLTAKKFNHEGTKARRHEGHEGIHEEAPPDRERQASIIVDSGLKVHRALAPGLLESAYEHCLGHELRTRGLAVERQTSLSIIYRGTTLDAGYRVDLRVERTIITAVNAVAIH